MSTLHNRKWIAKLRNEIIRPRKKGRRKGGLCHSFSNLGKRNHAKCPREFVAWPSGKEKLILPPIVRATATEFDPPEAVDVDGLAVRIFHGADELSGQR